MRVRLAWLVVLIGLLSCSACAGRFGKRSGTLTEAELGPLVDLIPAGPAYLIQARPRALAQQGATMRLWRALVSEQNERALAERTGIDPLTIDELVGIELAHSGYLLLVRGPFDARRVVERAGERLAVRDVVSDSPIARREGLAGQGRYAYAALSEHSVLIARDASPALVGQVIARSLNHTSEGALTGADARSLLAEHAASPLVLFAPRPLALEPGTNVALLFSRERAMAVSIHPTQTVLPIAIDLRGEFPKGAEHNFRALAKSLASAQLGRALGLSRVPESMAIRVDDRSAYVTFALVADELVAGVRMLFFEDLRTLFAP